MRMIASYTDLVDVLLEIVSELPPGYLTDTEIVEIERVLDAIRAGAELEFSRPHNCGLLLRRVLQCGEPIRSKGVKGLYEVLADQYLRGGLLPLRTETYLQAMLDITYMDCFLTIIARRDTTDVVMRNADGARCYEMNVAVSFPRDPTRRKRQQKASAKSTRAVSFQHATPPRR